MTRASAGLARAATAWAERGLLPDAWVRWGIRRMLAERLAELDRDPGATQRFVAGLADAPVAPSPDSANAQHYEVPPAFFRQVLGPRLKYSACLYPTGRESLAEAEEAMLALSCERAGLDDGMRVLDLGCGWGSLSLWIAERYPACRVLAVSNSKAQREHIQAERDRRGLRGVEVLTADANGFEPGGRFDRVLSVEMFEHLRNWPRMLSRIAGWLEPEGRLFLHFFSHERHAYPFETQGAGTWMARNFFTGGMMPSHGLLPSLDAELRVEAAWRIEGGHYARTCNDWLRQLDARREDALEVLRAAPDPIAAGLALSRWRLFFLACAELFAFGGGREWGVSHYRLAPRGEGV